MIYFDHNATTPPSGKVVEVMKSQLLDNWGNPSSSYRLGANARDALDEARGSVASFLNARPDQIVFTSGATESINSAIHSAVRSSPEKKHIVTSCVEHSATLAYCDYLESVYGYEVTRLPVSREGEIDLELLAKEIRKDTAIVSLIWANNETGVIWPMADISEICRSHGVPLHVDAVQAVGKMHVDFGALGADYLSLSGHKIGALKGSGALLVADPNHFKPLLHGGKQEDGLRGGTEAMPLIGALGVACEICASEAFGRWEGIRSLRGTFEAMVKDKLPKASIHGAGNERLPNTTSLYLPGIDSDAAVTYLDQKGICVSSGSACMESAIAPSHVIFSMTKSHEIASETLRISLGQNSTKEELDCLASELVQFVKLYA